MKMLLSAASVGLLLAAAPAWAQTQATPQNLSSQDQNFIKQAGDGNLSEATLGQLAEQKANSKAVKAFGRKMVTDHSQANRRLMQIAKQVGYNEEPQLTDKAKELQQKLQNASGPDFDRTYMDAMVNDHKDDLPAFRDEAQNGQNPQLKAYAHHTAEVVQKHLKMAERLDGKLAANQSAGYGNSEPTRHKNRLR